MLTVRNRSVLLILSAQTVAHSSWPQTEIIYFLQIHFIFGSFLHCISGRLTSGGAWESLNTLTPLPSSYWARPGVEILLPIMDMCELQAKWSRLSQCSGRTSQTVLTVTLRWGPTLGDSITKSNHQV